MTRQTGNKDAFCEKCGLDIDMLNGAWHSGIGSSVVCEGGRPHTPVLGGCRACWHICENELPGDAPALTAVVLFETNADNVVIARAGKAWNLGPVTPELAGGFISDARAWFEGEWEPNEDGQAPAHVHDLAAVAFWRPERVALLGPIGHSASSYAGPL